MFTTHCLSFHSPTSRPRLASFRLEAHLILKATSTSLHWLYYKVRPCFAPSSTCLHSQTLPCTCLPAALAILAMPYLACPCHACAHFANIFALSRAGHFVIKQTAARSIFMTNDLTVVYKNICQVYCEEITQHRPLQ